nr:hypothetical protein [uncultured Gellertiella sp.]
MGTISHLPRRDRPPPASLKSEAEAEAVLADLAGQWRTDPALKDEKRRDALRMTGLLSISLSGDIGGLDCQNGLLVKVINTLSPLSQAAAQALQLHYALLEAFRTAGDTHFYEQLAERVSGGDLIASVLETAEVPLDVEEGDFVPLAHGRLDLSAFSMFADWVLAPARATRMPQGAVLVPLRSAVLEVRPSDSGDRHVWTFAGASVVHAVWGEANGLTRSDTAAALACLLTAAGISGRLSDRHAGGYRMPDAGFDPLESVWFKLNQTDSGSPCCRLSIRENRIPLFPDKL